MCRPSVGLTTLPVWRGTEASNWRHLRACRGEALREPAYTSAQRLLPATTAWARCLVMKSRATSRAVSVSRCFPNVCVRLISPMSGKTTVSSRAHRAGCDTRDRYRLGNQAGRWNTEGAIESGRIVRLEYAGGTDVGRPRVTRQDRASSRDGAADCDVLGAQMRDSATARSSRLHLRRSCRTPVRQADQVLALRRRCRSSQRRQDADGVPVGRFERAMPEFASRESVLLAPQEGPLGFPGGRRSAQGLHPTAEMRADRGRKGARGDRDDFRRGRAREIYNIINSICRRPKVARPC